MFDIILKGTGTKPMGVFHNSGRPPRDKTILLIFFIVCCLASVPCAIRSNCGKFEAKERSQHFFCNSLAWYACVIQGRR